MLLSKSWAHTKALSRQALLTRAGQVHVTCQLQVYYRSQQVTEKEVEMKFERTNELL